MECGGSDAALVRRGAKIKERRNLSAVRMESQ